MVTYLKLTLMITGRNTQKLTEKNSKMQDNTGLFGDGL